MPLRPAAPVNGEATTAAYAEAVSDGVQDQLRRRLFAAIWVEGRPMARVDDVRQVIAEVMCPPEPILARLASPDLPSALLHDPDVNRIVRRSGGTVTLYSGPLTTAGYRRIRRWRHEWLALPCQVTPALIGPDGAVHPRSDALRHLAAVAGAGEAARGGR